MNQRSAQALGLVVGLSVGRWIGQQTRDRLMVLEPPRLVDWERAREIALRLSGGVRLSPLEREEATDRYRRLVTELAPAIADFVGSPVPSGIHRVYAFDRIDWIDANLEGFAEVLRPLEVVIQLPEQPLARAAAVLWAHAGRSAATMEVGMALGFLSRRVLGQYDIAVLGGEPTAAGKLYFVEPNIRWLIRNWRLPEHDFNRWLVLHEVTHAFEFESSPWLRDHVNGLLRQWVEALRHEGKLFHRVIEILRTARRGDWTADTTWMELLMSTEQRRLFRQLQAIMAVIEGYSNYVMREVGREIVESYPLIERRFEERERARTPAERLLLRLTGLDMKLEQYRRGEGFCRAIADRMGREAFAVLWRGPEWLPTYEELAEPDSWISRVTSGSSG